ncbi:hypothetical protein B1813_18915 [Saccharomonospora piscinae]|uniref:Uncharacterized protein n=1 Tax=Saccharomonospora piscinae TaxID=687388 RepID=A0A1V8ZYU1_SACPI|nr:hypothetical protein [Saccharomonospora piscinae]OQO89913.1 hypothetical protein B1813_18915 [Saccharomonospora piscinae]
MPSDPRAAVEAYAEPPHEWHLVPGHGVQPTPRRDRYAPRAFDALAAVLDLHQPGSHGVCDECGYQGVNEHPVDWPCPTVQAITTALEGKA